MAGITQHIIDCLRAHRDEEVLTGLRQFHREQWTADELADAVETLAAGLTGLGIAKGDHVGLVADNGDQWLITDLAILALGAIDVPRAADVSVDEIDFVLRHGECSWAVIETTELFDRLADRLRDNDAVRGIIVLRGDKREGTHSFDDVMDAGREALAGDADLVVRQMDAVDDDDLATIVYTSGTTGNPKGVMLRHGNILHNVRILPDYVGFTERDIYLSFLPSWHMFERTLDYCLISAGARIVYGDKRTLRKDLLSVRPTIVAGVPRVWESIVASALGKLEKASGAKKAFVGGLLGLSRRHVETRRRMHGFRLTDELTIDRARGLSRTALAAKSLFFLPGHLLCRQLVYGKVAAAVGGRVRFVVSGGGALPIHVDEFLNQTGLILLNGYGLTETSPVLSVRLPHRNVIGTAGQLLPQTAWRVMNEDATEELSRGKKGVLWVRGPQIMQGYFRNSDATDAVLVDGWFCTGDLAVLTDENDVVICGRAKDTIVLRGGENIEPESLEAELASSPLIADVIVVGHGCKHLAALMVPDFEVLGERVAEWRDRPTEEVASDPRCEEMLREEVGRLISAERGYRVFERVPKIAVLPAPFSIEDGTLTATMKKKRPVIESREAERIATLFDGDDNRVVSG